jgi:hypothetical protein
MFCTDDFYSESNNVRDIRSLSKLASVSRYIGCIVVSVCSVGVVCVDALFVATFVPVLYVGFFFLGFFFFAGGFDSETAPCCS